MSFGNNPADSAAGKQHSERFMANADAARAARLAGRKSFFQRLLERLRPHRQGLSGGDSQSSHGTSDDPGR
jgi:hypothetical protein